MSFKPEIVRVDVRLVGNVTGTIYAENTVAIVTDQKGHEIYLGGCFMAIPFYPTAGEPGPDLDPADTEIKIQYRTNSKNTRFGREEEGEFLFIGQAQLSFFFLPNGEIEIPSGFVS